MADYQGPYSGAQVDAALKAATELQPKVTEIDGKLTELAEEVAQLSEEINGEHIVTFDITEGKESYANTNRIPFNLKSGEFSVRFIDNSLLKWSYVSMTLYDASKEKIASYTTHRNFEKFQLASDAAYVGVYVAANQMNGSGSISLEFVAEGLYVGLKEEIKDIATKVAEIDEEALTLADETSNLSTYLQIEKVNATFTEGAYRHVDGHISTIDGYSRTTPLYLPKGSVILVNGVRTTSNVSVITQVDSDGNYVKTLLSGKDDLQDISFIVDENCYIEISLPTMYTQDLNVKFSNTFIKVLEKKILISTDDIEDHAITLNKLSFVEHNPDTNFINKWIDNVYIDESGKEIKHNGFFATDFIPLDSETSYYQKSLWYGYYAFYDKDFQLIEGHGNDGTLSSYFTTPLGTAFARFTATTEDSKNAAWISIQNTPPPPYGEYISPEVIPPLSANEKIFCDFEGQDISVFNKGICIGDSLTKGVMNYKDGDVDKYVSFEKYSYPAYLAKLTGIEIDNKGISGTTSFEWYNEMKDEDLSGYDFAIVQMGVNDTIRNNANYGTEWSAESQQGFTDIINKLKNENKGIKIFVATIIPADSYSSEKYIAICQQIRDFVAELNDANVILLDMQIYGHTKDALAYNCGHLSAYGYWRLAKDYQGIISYYINTHKMEFREVQFIGTDYSYSVG